MIFVFSGTGNSLHAATVLASRLADRVIAIADERKIPGNPLSYACRSGEALGFVFPIHAWGVPRFVLDFIRDVRIVGTPSYVFSLSTCGQEEGSATRTVERLLRKKGLVLDGAFTVAMPNNYLLGYDLESRSEQDLILSVADTRLETIAAVLAARKKAVRMLLPGKGAAVKTAVIHPLFDRFSVNSRPFFATDACIRCGLCVRICPVQTIRLDPLPVWGKACTQCLACINRCPVAAIEYGTKTAGRARYVHPDIR